MIVGCEEELIAWRRLHRHTGQEEVTGHETQHAGHGVADRAPSVLAHLRDQIVP